MRTKAVATIGVAVAVVGAVFALQGVGVLGGSFMSGSATWLVIGLGMIAAGVTAYAISTRAR